MVFWEKDENEKPRRETYLYLRIVPKTERVKLSKEIHHVVVEKSY